MTRFAALAVTLGLSATTLVGCGSKSKPPDTPSSTAPDSSLAANSAVPVAPSTTSASTAGTAVTVATAASAASTTSASTSATSNAPTTSANSVAGVGAPLPTGAGKGALKGKTVVYLINGALGDKGFYDSGEAGLKQMERTFGVKTRTLEANFDAAKYQALVDAAFEQGDVIFAISYGFEDALKAAAKAHPDKPVINIDFDLKDSDKHVASIDFIEEQSAYLAGVTAALATEDTSIPGMNDKRIIGVVGGDNDPVTNSFLFAFENGAKFIDGGLTVERKYLGGAWDDQAKGKQAAEQLYDSGADIVFQVAAAAGLGVLQAANDRNLYAIGVDSNQNDLFPGHVLASDVKNVGGSMLSLARTIDDGAFTPGKVWAFGIAEGGVDLVTVGSKQVLPKRILDTVADLRSQIAAGAVLVQRFTP